MSQPANVSFFSPKSSGMYFYLITWGGVYLGASAVVRAHSEEEAVAILCAKTEAHAKAEDCKIERFLLLEDEAQVLYLDNGDY